MRIFFFACEFLIVMGVTSLGIDAVISILTSYI